MHIPPVMSAVTWRISAPHSEQLALGTYMLSWNSVKMWRGFNRCRRCRVPPPFLGKRLSHTTALSELPLQPVQSLVLIRRLSFEWGSSRRNTRPATLHSFFLEKGEKRIRKFLNGFAFFVDAQNLQLSAFIDRPKPLEACFCWFCFFHFFR